MAPVETLVQGGHGLTSPTFDRRGRLLVASSNSGEVHQVVTEGASSTLQTIFNTGGSPAWATLPRSHATARCPGRLGRAASGSGCCTLVVCPLVRAHSHQFPCLGPRRLTLVAVRRRRGRGLRVRRGAPGGVPARRGRAAERVRQGVRGEALQGPLSDAARQRRQHVLHRQRPAGRDHAAESEGIDLPDQRRWPAAAAPAARGARPPVRPRPRPRRARHLCRREDAGATPCL